MFGKLFGLMWDMGNSRRKTRSSGNGGGSNGGRGGGGGGVDDSIADSDLFVGCSERFFL